jgi:hypothetical protein
MRGLQLHSARRPTIAERDALYAQIERAFDVSISDDQRDQLDEARSLLFLSVRQTLPARSRIRRVAAALRKLGRAIPQDINELEAVSVSLADAGWFNVMGSPYRIEKLREDLLSLADACEDSVAGRGGRPPADWAPLIVCCAAILKRRGARLTEFVMACGPSGVAVQSEEALERAIARILSDKTSSSSTEV